MTTMLRQSTVTLIIMVIMSLTVLQVSADNTDPDAEPVAPSDPCFFLGGDVQMVPRSLDDINHGLVDCNTVGEAGVGNLEVIMDGVIRAVDVFGDFNGFVDVCLLGSGNLVFLDAANAPRVPTPLAGGFGNGYTCTVISTAGTVVLVEDEASAPIVNTTDSDTGITADLTTDAVTTTTTTTTTTVTTTTTTNNAANVVYHTVSAGENLFRIGLRYGIPYQQIATDNGIGADYRIFVGQQLIINLPA